MSVLGTVLVSWSADLTWHCVPDLSRPHVINSSQNLPQISPHKFHAPHEHPPHVQRAHTSRTLGKILLHNLRVSESRINPARFNVQIPPFQHLFSVKPVQQSHFSTQFCSVERGSISQVSTKHLAVVDYIESKTGGSTTLVSRPQNAKRTRGPCFLAASHDKFSALGRTVWTGWSPSHGGRRCTLGPKFSSSNTTCYQYLHICTLPIISSEPALQLK